MNKTYVLWIIGALIVIAVGASAYFLTQPPVQSSPTPAPSTTSTTGTTQTTNTSPTGVKPIVVTTGFARVSSTTATIVGNIVPGSSATTYWFEYGPTPALGISLNNKVIIPAGSQKVGVSSTITGLKPSKPYYFRLGAKNSYGTVYGSPYSFITPSK